MGMIVLDAGVVIALLDANDSHHAAARDALAARATAGTELVLPASAYAETLVGAFRRDEASAGIVDELLDTVPIAVQPIDRTTARQAAQLRATHAGHLRLPDALVVATAVALGADELLTTDRRWPDVSVAVTKVV